MGQKRKDSNSPQIDKEGSIQFLLAEFNQCFLHLRHHDNIRVSLTKFSVSFYSALAVASFALERYFYYQLGVKSIDLYLGVALAFAFAVGIIIILMLARTRKYFIAIVRQLGAVREVFMRGIKDAGIDFESHLPVGAARAKPLNLKSNYLLTLYLICLMNSIPILFSVVLFLRYFSFNLTSLWWVAALVAALSLFVELLVVIRIIGGKKWELR
ncbi:hypothetical protein ES703_105034 [subsurface metagenome]